MRHLLLILIFPLAFACKQETEEQKVKAINKDNLTKLVRVCEKLFKERPAERMHKMALTVQRTRSIKCKQPEKVCRIYWTIIDKMIRFTVDGELSSIEFKEIEADILLLRNQK